MFLLNSTISRSLPPFHLTLLWPFDPINMSSFNKISNNNNDRQAARGRQAPERTHPSPASSSPASRSMREDELQHLSSSPSGSPSPRARSSASSRSSPPLRSSPPRQAAGPAGQPRAPSSLPAQPTAVAVAARQPPACRNTGHLLPTQDQCREPHCACKRGCQDPSCMRCIELAMTNDGFRLPIGLRLDHGRVARELNSQMGDQHTSKGGGIH